MKVYVYINIKFDFWIHFNLAEMNEISYNIYFDQQHLHFLPTSGKASNYSVGLLTIKSGLLSIYFEFEGSDHNGICIKSIIQSAGTNLN